MSREGQGPGLLAYKAHQLVHLHHFALGGHHQNIPTTKVVYSLNEQISQACKAWRGKRRMSSRDEGEE